MATLVLVVTAIVRKMQASTVSPPGWILTITSTALNNRVGQFFLPTVPKGLTTLENESDDVNDEKKLISSENLQWRQFSAFVEWLLFFVVLMCYVLMFVTFIPAEPKDVATDD